AGSGEAAKAKLGKPFRLHIIRPDALQRYASTEPVSAMVSDLDQWFFPITLEDKSKAILIVWKNEGRWEVAGLGHADLAREVQAVRKECPAAKGYDPKIIIIPQAGRFLFTIPEKSKDNLTPIGAVPDKTGTLQTQAASTHRYGSLSRASDLIGDLRE